MTYNVFGGTWKLTQAQLLQSITESTPW